MKLKSVIIAAIAAIGLTACTSPISHTNVPMSTYDKDTEYNITPNEDGFAITVFYSRYQYIPESDSVATACKQQLTAIAWEHSDNTKREIEQINEQRIRVSMGRNGLTGITSCQAVTSAKWKQ